MDPRPFAAAGGCFSGEEGGILAGWGIYDPDGDSDIDLDDFERLVLTRARP